MFIHLEIPVCTCLHCVLYIYLYMFVYFSPELSKVSPILKKEVRSCLTELVKFGFDDSRSMRLIYDQLLLQEASLERLENQMNLSKMDRRDLTDDQYIVRVEVDSIRLVKSYLTSCFKL